MLGNLEVFIQANITLITFHTLILLVDHLRCLGQSLGNASS
jgi:hypothetical protein